MGKGDIVWDNIYSYLKEPLEIINPRRPVLQHVQLNDRLDTTGWETLQVHRQLRKLKSNHDNFYTGCFNSLVLLNFHKHIHISSGDHQYFFIIKIFFFT
jgi:hypothetical protein